MEKQNTLSSAP